MTIYLAGPFRAASVSQMGAHVLTAQAAALEVIRLGHLPYTPHAALGWAYGHIHELDADRINDAFLLMCEAVLLLPGWGQSAGSRRELELAKDRGLLVFRSLAEVQGWAE
jgi:hypothetical protein